MNRKETMTMIVVSNIVSLRKQGRSEEIEGYMKTIVDMGELTKEEVDICASLAIKNMQRLGMMG